jgi:pilus assembly protein Flp/PilA
MNMLVKLAAEAKGATAIEYALLAALIAVAAMGGYMAVGNSVENTFNTVSGKVHG